MKFGDTFVLQQKEHTDFVELTVSWHELSMYNSYFGHSQTQNR